MKKIYITETQLAKLAKMKMNEDGPLGGPQTTGQSTAQGSTSNNGNTQPQTPNNSQAKTIETQDGTITTDPKNKTTVVSLNNKLMNASTAKSAARSMLQQNGVQYNPQKTSVTDSSNGIPTPVPNNITSPETYTKTIENGYNVGDKIKPTISMTENFITKKDIREARKQRLMSESTPYTKSELFGVIAESGKMYNFRFNDGETYRVPGNEVEKFKEYVFEQDGSREGKEYIIEKIDY